MDYHVVGCGIVVLQRQSQQLIQRQEIDSSPHVWFTWPDVGVKDVVEAGRTSSPPKSDGTLHPSQSLSTLGTVKMLQQMTRNGRQIGSVVVGLVWATDEEITNSHHTQSGCVGQFCDLLEILLCSGAPSSEATYFCLYKLCPPSVLIDDNSIRLVVRTSKAYLLRAAVLHSEVQSGSLQWSLRRTHYEKSVLQPSVHCWFLSAYFLERTWPTCPSCSYRT